MNAHHLTKDQWTELFRDVGMSDAMMHQWHVEFERRAPLAHQSFLEWLGLDDDEVAEIRQRFAS